jgi:hypothetical protein
VGIRAFVVRERAEGIVFGSELRLRGGRGGFEAFAEEGLHFFTATRLGRGGRSGRDERVWR